jgi:hypothetical protein
MNREPITPKEYPAFLAAVNAALASMEPWGGRLPYLSWAGQCEREAVRYLRLLAGLLRRAQGAV